MSSVNLLTGLSTGRFDTLKVKNPLTGEYEAILPSTANNLMQIYVGGVLYSSATALNFANALHILDPVTGIMNIGAPLYQGFVRIGDGTTNSDLSRGSGGELLWDGAEVALAGSGGSSLLKLAVSGIVFPATTLAFNNSFSHFDPGTSTLQIGGPLYQGFVRIGDGATYSDLSRG